MMLLFHRRRSTVESLAIYTEHNFSFYVCCCLVAEITLCGVCAMGEWFFFYLFFSFFSFLLLYYFHAQTCIHNANAYIIPFFLSPSYSELHYIIHLVALCFHVKHVSRVLRPPYTFVPHMQSMHSSLAWLRMDDCVCVCALVIGTMPSSYTFPRILCNAVVHTKFQCHAMRCHATHTHSVCVLLPDLRFPTGGCVVGEGNGDQLSAQQQERKKNRNNVTTIDDERANWLNASHVVRTGFFSSSAFSFCPGE